LFGSWQKKQLFWFFQRWLGCRQKTKCAVCALAFLVQMFNFSSISALLTTSGYTHLSHKYPLYLFNIFFGIPTMAFGVSDIN